MLKKAKKSRRNASQAKAAHQNNNDSSPSTSHNQAPHLGVSSQTSQNTAEDQNSGGAHEEELDAFL